MKKSNTTLITENDRVLAVQLKFPEYIDCVCSSEMEFINETIGYSCLNPECDFHVEKE